MIKFSNYTAYHCLKRVRNGLDPNARYEAGNYYFPIAKKIYVLRYHRPVRKWCLFDDADNLLMICEGRTQAVNELRAVYFGDEQL